jgi:hypothetical protein
MARLETRLRTTWKKLADESYKSVEEFYSLVHHFDRLQARYKKAYHTTWNPVQESGWFDYRDDEGEKTE